MSILSTTRMSSRGQVVIPEDVRNRIGLKSGDRFVVMGEKDVVILKAISSPSMREFDSIIRKCRKQARAAGMKRSDIAKAAKRARKV